MKSETFLENVNESLNESFISHDEYLQRIGESEEPDEDEESEDEPEDEPEGKPKKKRKGEGEKPVNSGDE